jgi:hypothetical protein
MSTATARSNLRDDWGLLVNECRIFATGIGVDRWLDFQFRARDDRLVMLAMGPGGGEWHVMCGSREDAVEARDLFIEMGFHRGHVKVERPAVSQRKAASRAERAGRRGDE